MVSPSHVLSMAWHGALDAGAGCIPIPQAGARAPPTPQIKVGVVS